MGRLIDTDTLLTALIDAYGLDPERLKDVVNRVPSAQLEVIRCENCDFFDGHDWCNHFGNIVRDDDYCSKGAKKNG